MFSKDISQLERKVKGMLKSQQKYRVLKRMYNPERTGMKVVKDEVK